MIFGIIRCMITVLCEAHNVVRKRKNTARITTQENNVYINWHPSELCDRLNLCLRARVRVRAAAHAPAGQRFGALEHAHCDGKRVGSVIPCRGWRCAARCSGKTSALHNSFPCLRFFLCGYVWGPRYFVQCPPRQRIICIYAVFRLLHTVVFPCLGLYVIVHDMTLSGEYPDIVSPA